MTALNQRDRRALAVLGLAVVVCVAIWLWPASEPSIDISTDTVPQAEKRLTRTRKLSATVPALQSIDEQYSTALAAREKGLILAETPAQAQAQLLQIVRKVASAQAPPIEMKGSEFSPVHTYGKYYGEVSVTISAVCGIEQVVNFLADLGNQPEMIATQSMSFGAAHQKKKTVPVRLTITGLVQRKLVPEKKAEGAF